MGNEWEGREDSPHRDMRGDKKPRVFTVEAEERQSGWCSICNRDAVHGVVARASSGKNPLFICRRCIRRFAHAAELP